VRFVPIVAAEPVGQDADFIDHDFAACIPAMPAE
jgi:hypothetical protein